MTKTEILQGNKLIAEFMQLVKYKTPKDNELGFTEMVDAYIIYHMEWPINDLKYHSHWDWLMPVIEKISKVEIENGEIIHNGEDSYFDSYYMRTFGMINSETKEFMVRINRFPLHQSGSLIEAAYSAVVEFIKHYNK